MFPLVGIRSMTSCGWLCCASTYAAVTDGSTSAAAVVVNRVGEEPNITTV
jgi:hypothetical protein